MESHSHQPNFEPSGLTDDQAKLLDKIAAIMRQRPERSDQLRRYLKDLAALDELAEDTSWISILDDLAEEPIVLDDFEELNDDDRPKKPR